VNSEKFIIQNGRVTCNGKPANVWIDKDNKIGSNDGGGPTIVNWLSWYKHDMGTIAKIVKELFPEIGE